MTHKRKMIIGALLLTVGTLVAAMIWQFEKPGSLVWDDGFKYQTDSKMSGELVTHDLPVVPSKITALEIDVKNADVKIIKGEQFKVTTRNWSSKGATQISFDAGQLTINDSEGEASRSSFGIGMIIRMNQITITLPESQHLSTLLVKSRNGDLDVEQVSVKTAQIMATNGDTKFERATFGDLMMTSTNGEIQLKRTSIENGGQIINQNGDIEIKDSRLPTFYAKTKWGDEDVELYHDLRQSSQSQAKLVVTSQNGDLEID
ncbi:MAG: DUF4097 domain-containing protein [Lactococcus chungangensis]|uniref:DUF4097 domain-containing protein n=1 Tax=Pseudolactococcus chungangensis TaxID=451457 RepID=A0A847J3Q7_9LACT|nr:DUF4097 domain-containing protein [Lactococcus chungangensis]